MEGPSSESPQRGSEDLNYPSMPSCRKTQVVSTSSAQGLSCRTPVRSPVRVLLRCSPATRGVHLGPALSSLRQSKRNARLNRVPSANSPPPMPEVEFAPVEHPRRKRPTVRRKPPPPVRHLEILLNISECHLCSSRL
ncbi:hypothetical protein R1sor_016739 [Riccia sorocarpa]|uniref:Uncharacterized protein n=1 Tax=Riccia sorocarpa TaxID=122646 RepID=A0ABD3HJF4_9MARC